MIIKPVKVTLDRVRSMTRMRQEQTRKFRSAIDDPQRAQRLAAHECVICFYVAAKIGGAAMSETNCGHCEKVIRFGSTCVDALCPECAGALRLCKHCGADIELKARRRLTPHRGITGQS